MFLSCKRSLQLVSAPSYKLNAGVREEPTVDGLLIHSSSLRVEVTRAGHSDTDIGTVRLTSFNFDTAAACADSLAHPQQSMRVRALQILWADADAVIGNMH